MTDSAWRWPNLDLTSAGALVSRSLAGPPGESLEPLGAGDFCLAFRFGTRVVRVARHAQAADAMRREACVLATIAGRLPVEVPHLELHQPAGCPPFTIHEEIVGEALTRESWLSMPGPARECAAMDVAGFLGALHAVRDIYLRQLPVKDSAENRADPFAPRFWEQRLDLPM